MSKLSNPFIDSTTNSSKNKGLFANRLTILTALTPALMLAGCLTPNPHQVASAQTNPDRGNATGTGMPLQSNSQFYQVAPQKALNLTDEVTLEAWVQADKMQPAGGRILDKGVPFTLDGYSLDTYPGNSLRFSTQGGVISYNAQLPSDQWTQVVGVYSASKRILKLYINGKEVASTNEGNFPPMSVSQAPLRIGADSKGENLFKGRILQAAIYNRALTSTEIEKRFNTQVKVPGTLAEWQFNANSGARIPASTGSLSLERTDKNAPRQFPKVVLKASKAPFSLPPVPPMPPIPAPQPIDSVPMGDINSAPEVHLNLPIQPGPFQPTWDSIEQNYPGTPDWLREAKFGIWVHFGPQAAGESGDWYARKMYKPGDLAYDNHLKKYGPPSVSGYKDFLHTWNPVKLDPAKLTQIYKDAGARFLIVQGVHHDNFDSWNSKYQPWNSVRLGPHRDLLAEWSKAAHKAKMRYGVAFHHEYTWWWWQTAFNSDKDGPLAGVPYDGHETLADGQGKWWQGLDPRQLYGIDLREYKGVTAAADSQWSPPPPGVFSRHMDYAKWYATQWALRMMDVIENYDPDFIYTDGTSTQPFSGSGTGTGIKADAMQRVIADFYNHTLKTRGKVDTFSIVKFRPQTNGTVNTEEFGIPEEIKTDQPWIGEIQAGDWFYRPGLVYNSTSMIRYIIEAAARDGNAAINVPLLPDGSLDEGSLKVLQGVGVWMRRNGQAIYGSRAWIRPGEGEMINGHLKMIPGGPLDQRHVDIKFGPQDFRFTVGKDGALYAICLAVPPAGTQLKITSLGTRENLLEHPISKVTLLGQDGARLAWKQEEDGLVITCPDTSTLTSALVFRVVAK